MFEILVASATLIVNIFILRQYVRQESRDMPRLFDDADYNSGICSMQFESTSGSLSRRLFHPTFLLSPFPSLSFSPSRLNYESLQETTNSNASLSLNKAIRIEMSVDGDVVRLITALA